MKPQPTFDRRRILREKVKSLSENNKSLMEQIITALDGSESQAEVDKKNEDEEAKNGSKRD